MSPTFLSDEIFCNQMTSKYFSTSVKKYSNCKRKGKNSVIIMTGYFQLFDKFMINDH